ncbi:MAG: adenine nucleotide alpha hydrolase family protein, partial [Anaerolineaceae bacterium]|nr:adenine nucleotide alpha hydrolase family protein [Anaerolineaceae bacterium]
VLVAVSGGKDSLALWDVLNKLGYLTAGVYINLGISGDDQYSLKSQTIAEKFASERNLILHVTNIESDYGKTIPEFSETNKRGKSKPCSVCGLIKRHTMNEIASKHGYDVLVTGHNLDDEVSVLFNNVLGWQVDFLRRQSPLIPAKVGLIPKAKPFCRFYERETAAYAILANIEYIEEECPFSEGSTTIQNKELLNQLEHNRAGTKLAFYLKFLNAKKELFVDLNQDKSMEELSSCQTCGQPTPKPGNCTFCRMVTRS